MLVLGQSVSHLSLLLARAAPSSVIVSVVPPSKDNSKLSAVDHHLLLKSLEGSPNNPVCTAPIDSTFGENYMITPEWHVSAV